MKQADKSPSGAVPPRPLPSRPFSEFTTGHRPSVIYDPLTILMVLVLVAFGAVLIFTDWPVI